MAHLKDSIMISAPVDKVDAFVSDPHNWCKYWVGLGEPEKITGDGGPGTVVEQSMVWFGMRMPLVIRTTENTTEPDGASHWRGELSGGAPGWQTFDLKPCGGGPWSPPRWSTRCRGACSARWPTDSFSKGWRNAISVIRWTD